MCLALPGGVALGAEERVSVPKDMGREVSDLANCPMGEGRESSHALQDINGTANSDACWVRRRCICSSIGEMLVP